MRSLVLLGGGSALALLFAATGALAGGMGYGGVAPGQCGPRGCGAPGPVGFGPGQATNEDYPPNAAPGQCFTKILVPEVTETYTETVVVSPEKTDIRVIPGGVTTEQKSVLQKEESVEYLSIAATYRTVSETVVVKPGYTRTETIPATYETVTEKVKVKDGFTAWRPGSTVAGYAPGSANTYGSGQTSRPEGFYGPTRVLPTGEVLCLVEVPPEFRTITRQVLRTPARTVEIPVPPETSVITRQVIDQPAHVEKKIIPAVYGTITIKVRAPDQTEPVVTPAVTNTYTKVKVVSPSRFEWKQVDCRTDVTHSSSYTAPMMPPPPMRYYSEQPRPHPHKHYAPMKTYQPTPAPRFHGAGKQCHTTTTCDGETPSSYAPPAPVPTYHRSEVTPPIYAAPSGGGDRAVASLQGALQSRGYYTGPQNGLFTQDTLQAMVKYQEDNHLAAGRYTGETANALGIAAR